MASQSRQRFTQRLICGTVGVTLFTGAALQAQTTIFSETFNGYLPGNGGAGFPDEFPVGDPINFGVPLIGEGADETWYGARFEQPDPPANADPIEDIKLDIGVQKIPGGGRPSPDPVGRAGDDAGIVLQVPDGYTDITIDFDWRTFSAGSTDRIVVGYHLGEPTVGSNSGFDLSANRIRDFYGEFVAIEGSASAGQTAAIDWWANSWTELMRQTVMSNWQNETFALPDTSGTPLYVAFWVDNGDSDFIKIDNVVITGTLVPEPATMTLLALGGLAALKRRN